MKTCTKSLAIKKLIAAVFICHRLSSGATAAPNDYEQVKTTLDKYVNEIDYPTKEGSEARTSLRQQVDEATPALMLLFDENENERYRAAIIALFYYAKTSRNQISTFMVGQMKTPPDQWKGDSWIRSAIKLLVQLDPVNAGQVARRALLSPNPYIQVAAVNALGKIGSADDVKLLEMHAAHRVALSPTHAKDELSTEAEVAADEIVKRLQLGN